jgi:hypothetical protein
MSARKEWLCIFPDQPGMKLKKIEAHWNADMSIRLAIDQTSESINRVQGYLANLKPFTDSRAVVVGGSYFSSAHNTT